MKQGFILVRRPLGNCGYVVARFDGNQMRIAHQTDLASARMLEREWANRDFSFDAGITRTLNSIATSEVNP